MGRSPRAPALVAALVLVALVGPAAAASSVFTALGNSFVVSTPEWTLMSPFSQTGGGIGVFYNATSIFTFTAPKNRGPRSRDGTTVKSTTTMRFNKVTLTPVTVTASSGLQPIPGAVGPVLRRLRVRLPKGSLVPQTTGVTFVPQGTAFPYSVLYGGPSQTSATLLTPNTGAKILGKPQLKYGKDKPIQISTSSPTFQLATAGTASALCANGYGGAVGTAASGCAQCKAGSFASGFDQSTPCKACSSVSSNSISAQAGASSCTNCTAGTTPNANGTACVGGGSVTPVTNTLSMTAPGPCSTATAAQIKASQEAFILSQPGVQSVNVTVTCAPANRRRALLQTNGTVVYTSTVTCIGTTSTTQCTAGFTALTAQVSPCCPRSASCTAPLLTPANCTGTTTGTGCAANFYVANGTCVSCGSGATSPGGSVTSCTCTNGGTWSASTGCPTGVSCTPGTYFVAGACALCPANSYCLGGIGTQAVATPCPGTTSTNGFTAQTSVLGCAQGNSFKSLASNPAQSWTSIASFGGIIATPTEGQVRVAAGTNGLLYGSTDGGLTWAPTGPDSTSRAWTAVSTCQATLQIAASTAATAPLAIVAVADNGGIWIAFSDSITALPAANKWVKVSASSGTTAPLDSLVYTSVACASPVYGAAAPTGAWFFVIASSGGAAGQAWLGRVAVPALVGGVIPTPTSASFTWGQVSDTTLTSNIGGPGDFSSVAAATAGDASAAQGLAFSVARKGGAGVGKLYTATVTAAASGTSPTGLTWLDRSADVTVGGVAQTNFVSVDISTQGTGGGAPAADALPIVAAVGGGRIFRSVTSAAGTAFTVVSASDQPWVSVDFNFAGTAVAAAASVGGIWFTATPATGNSLTNVTVATAITQANTVSFPQAWTDIVVVGSPATAITATLPGSVGYGIQQGTFVPGTFVWSNAAASNSRVWVDVATSASGARVVAITSTDVYISNNNGSTWGASVFTGTALASVSTDSTGNVISVLSTSTGRVYTSTDGGVNWFIGGAALTNGGATATQVKGVSVNADGTRIYATTKATGGVANADGFIYVGTGNFQTFAPASTVTARDWEYIKAGAGLNLVASTTTGTVYNSIDGAVNMVAQSTGLTASRTWKVQASANGNVLAALDAAGVEAFTTTCTLGTTTCASWTKVSPTNFPTSGLQAVSLSADGGRLFVASNVNAASSGGLWTGTATATPGTFNWIGPKLAGALQTSIANIASSSNGGFVYAAASTGGPAGGPTGAAPANAGQVWQGFGAV